MSRYRLSVVGAAVLLAVAGGAQDASGRPPERAAAAETALCQRAIRDAARATAVPLRLLHALAPTESGVDDGRGGRGPWPWTLNVDGHGRYFHTRRAAERKLRRLLASGIENIDIGCMQVNWKWHHKGFRSPAAALDPKTNVLFAARLLRQYKRQAGTWAGAVGLYHSHDPRRAALYRCRVARALAPHQPRARC
jgi:hypothetical protein